MEMELMDENTDNCDTKYKVILVPWKNKDEFTEVYNLLFNENPTLEMKQKAYNQMLIWKLRRADMTPASILSTMSLLNVDIKADNNQDSNELQTMYSDAFMKFINYMTSVKQGNKFRTLYKSAELLGLDSFLIDLRHLCSHGQKTPSLEVFVRSSKYCMNWLKEFFWDDKLKNFKPVYAKDLYGHGYFVTEKCLTEVFSIYDWSSEAFYLNYTNVAEIKRNFGAARITALREYTENLDGTEEIESVIEKSLAQFSKLLKIGRKIKKLPEILCNAILDEKNQRFFLEAPTSCKNKSFPATKLYQQLFRILAQHGLIDEILMGLIKIFENNGETKTRRMGAVIWTEKIINGIFVLHKMKLKLKRICDNSVQFKLDLSKLNDGFLINSLRSFYDLDDINNLVFGETQLRPINFHLTREFIQRRIANVNQYSMINGFLKTLLKYSVEFNVLSSADCKILENIIEVYMGEERNNTNDKINMDQTVVDESNCNEIESKWKTVYTN